MPDSVDELAVNGISRAIIERGARPDEEVKHLGAWLTEAGVEVVWASQKQLDRRVLIVTVHR